MSCQDGREIWLFDAGNSRLKYARLEHACSEPACLEPAGSEHTRLERARSEMDGMPQAVTAVTLGVGVDAHDLPRGDVAYVASVAAQPVTMALLAALGTRFRRVSEVRTQAHLAGLQVAYPHPERLGVDRFLALLAAARQADDVVLVGVGTALTIDLLDRAGRHHGGRIAPSPTLMREALHERVHQLPVSGGVGHVFADDTADALASGCDGAALALIQHSLQAATERLQRVPALVMHGGGAHALLPELPLARHRPDLVLQGLARWVQVAEAEACANVQRTL